MWWPLQCKQGGGKQSFIISQKQSEKRNEYLEEDQRIAGGIITESDESWYYPSLMNTPTRAAVS
jgi:hypothetical protein